MEKIKSTYHRTKSEKVFILGSSASLHYILLVVFILVSLYGLLRWMNRGEWDTLIHEQYSFSIDYPANWKHDTYGEKGSKNLHDQKAQIFTNVIGPLGPTTSAVYVYWKQFDDPTIKEIDSWGKDQLSFLGGNFSEFDEVQIGKGNYPALVRTFEFSHSAQTSIQYHIVHENTGYLLEFYFSNESNIDEASPILDQMLASFEILD